MKQVLVFRAPSPLLRSTLTLLLALVSVVALVVTICIVSIVTTDSIDGSISDSSSGTAVDKDSDYNNDCNYINRLQY